MRTPAQPGRGASKKTSPIHLNSLMRPGRFFALSVLVMTLVGCAGLKPVTLHHEVEVDLEVSQKMAESALKVYQKYVELSGNEELRQRVSDVRSEVMRWRELLKEQHNGNPEKTDYVK